MHHETLKDSSPSVVAKDLSRFQFMFSWNTHHEASKDSNPSVVAEDLSLFECLFGCNMHDETLKDSNPSLAAMSASPRASAHARASKVEASQHASPCAGGLRGVQYKSEWRAVGEQEITREPRLRRSLETAVRRRSR